MPSNRDLSLAGTGEIIITGTAPTAVPPKTALALEPLADGGCRVAVRVSAAGQVDRLQVDLRPQEAARFLRDLDMLIRGKVPVATELRSRPERAGSIVVRIPTGTETVERQITEADPARLDLVASFLLDFLESAGLRGAHALHPLAESAALSDTEATKEETVEVPPAMWGDPAGRGPKR